MTDTGGSFEIIPAIDLRDGRCVRLLQGDYARETVYSDDPVAAAQRWQELGASRLHVVDLDGARDGSSANRDAVERIVASAGVPVELGGGIRDFDDVKSWLEHGVDRIYLGTAAVTDPDLVSRACTASPGRVAVGIDARDGRIAMRGWREDSGLEVIDFARRVVDSGVRVLAYTDVARDGTLSGPDTQGVGDLIQALDGSGAEIILAGGVGDLEHVKAATLVPSLSGLIIGRALYEGSLQLEDALAAASSAAKKN